MAPRARSKPGAPIFEPEVFRKQMYCIEECTCDNMGIFGAAQYFGARVIAPLAPSLRPCWSGLPSWPFWGQISEIWSQITLVGPKIFVWPFSGMGWPLARIRSDHPVSCLRNHIFSLFWLIHCRFSPNLYFLKVSGYKILLGSLEFLS